MKSAKRINLRLLVAIAVAVLIGIVGVAVVHRIQVRRNASGLAALARLKVTEGPPGEAIMLYARYLRFRPDDATAQAEFARLLVVRATAANAGKGGDCFLYVREGDAVEMGGGNSHGGVADIELAYHGQLEFGIEQFEPTGVSGVLDGLDSAAAVWGEADFHDCRPAVFGDIATVCIVAVDQHHALGGDHIQQSAEAEFDFVQIAEDVSVIELEVVYDDQFREVMEEFGAFVEKSGVIFVAL